MNTIATMTGQAYRAAFAVAPKKDVRPYLNGLHLDLEAGKLVSTDGHMMYINDVELGDEPGPSLVFEPVKIPAAAETVDVNTYDDEHVMINVFGPRTGPTMHLCKIIEGRYPDYQAVIPGVGHKRGAVGFDVKYLAVLKQVFKRGARFKFSEGAGLSACKITGADGEGMIVLMELRK